MHFYEETPCFGFKSYNAISKKESENDRFSERIMSWLRFFHLHWFLCVSIFSEVLNLCRRRVVVASM